MDKSTIIYIDEEQSALDIYGGVLRDFLPEDVSIECMLPKQTLSEMLSILCQKRGSVVSIILDEHLEVAGTASYIGSELADAYRQIDDKIPIYILSNDPNDVDGNLKSIEYVLSKDDFADGGPALESAAKRIVRHMHNYDKITGEREIRFLALLQKYMKSDLSAEEASEFEQLKFWREAPIAIEESSNTLSIKSELDEQEKLIQEIEQLLAEK
ncbi:hypothetical protein ABE525_22120 [Pseudomonas wadenswilerensis]|jgi:hypothetical protein|uniref:hypothetical protein n=1 Tax=Pseudomonas TaxID=286 RepID=UPI00205EBF94|nr:hypothetical protein [Pseudomonas sp. IsoF]MCO3321076.1 hypothetical protein [Pseudomonas aeruginosa]UPL05735.1 hypothetical protein PisoF_01396 [Pseudomonas sp. IsoF]HCE9913486.1 hypothetical protein [Pseudomonas aeruginosa]HCW0470242.1 hypothetical protein [Pseudomonas aeruginosa]HCW0939377.1 hypothetical protein [Pseudomonas aeruginosa]